MRWNTPLRYPGGKGKLTDYFERILSENSISGTYIEPFAGGAGVAVNLLLSGKVEDVVINDADISIYYFWRAVTEYPDDFIRKVRETEVSVEEWDSQRDIQRRKHTAGMFELGFSTFYLNRTNRSGIISGGIIGGRAQEGPFKIDARFNKETLIRQIEEIKKKSDRIRVSGYDANRFLKRQLVDYDVDNTLVYIDPPYYEKGDLLYMNYYKDEDHTELSETIRGLQHRWVLSYDNVEFISKLYSGKRFTEVDMNYSSFEAKKSRELFFHSQKISMPV